MCVCVCVCACVCVVCVCVRTRVSYFVVSDQILAKEAPEIFQLLEDYKTKVFERACVRVYVFACMSVYVMYQLMYSVYLSMCTYVCVYMENGSC